MKIILFFFTVFVSCVCASKYICAQGSFIPNQKNDIVTGFCAIKNFSFWQLSATVKLKFCTFHPQGMIKIGDFFYLSAVEKLLAPKKFKTIQNGFHRSTGKGIEHLFKFDKSGELILKIILGDSIDYHPGGIDFDGKYIWVPVAEYRPDSRSIIYRIDPYSLASEKIFTFPDHIGALACDTLNNKLIGVSWGSRKIYAWKIEFSEGLYSFGKYSTSKTPKFTENLNGSFYIDYQDCHNVGDHYMLCSGLKRYYTEGLGNFVLGVLELIDLNTLVPIHQVPVNLYAKPGLVLTNNPFYVENSTAGLRFYFIPQDNESEMYIYLH